MKLKLLELSTFTLFILSFLFISLILGLNEAEASITEYDSKIIDIQSPDVEAYYMTPTEIRIDSNGDLFLLDFTTQYIARVQKLNSSGVALDSFGGKDGSGNGQFTAPKGMAIDNSDNIYVADTQNNRIQKFDSSGTYITKWGTTGSGNGQFNGVWAIAVDSSDNLYVADYNNNRIQKFDSDGVYITKWGTTGSANGELSGPRGIAVDGSNNVYVVELLNRRIQKFDSSGTYLTKWGSLGSGNGQFTNPEGIYIDSSDNVSIVDTGNHRIQTFDTSGSYVSKFGSFGTSDGTFFNPTSATVDGSGNFYVTDGSKRVQKLNSSGAHLSTWRSEGTGNGEFDRPYDVAADTSNNIYVTEWSNDRIQKFDSSGSYLTQWGSSGSGNGEFDRPEGIAVDSSNNVYVADTDNNRIQKFDSSGTYSTQWGSFGSGNSQFDEPVRITIDSSNNVYVVDQGNDRVQKFDSSGTYLSQFGSSGSGDGEFSSPDGIGVDSSGNVYVSDGTDIQKFDSSGTYLTKWGSSGTGDSQFDQADGIAVDSSDNIYVTDQQNGRVQKFDSSGTYLDQWGSTGSGTNEFVAPRGIDIDSVGAVYVVDGNNNRVQKFNSLFQIANLNSGMLASDDGDNDIEIGGSNGLTGTGNTINITKGGVRISDVVVDMSSDRDWSSVTGDVDLAGGKSVISNLTSAPGTAGTHTLYIPKLANQGAVIICPDATTLSEVTTTCSNFIKKTAADGDTSVVNIGGQDYWKVTGMTGTGGLGTFQSGTAFTLTPDSSAASATQEVAMTYTTGSGFISGDQIVITWESGDLTLANTCSVPTTDADGDATGDGAAGIASNVYTYTFTGSTTLTSISLCVNVTAYSAAGSYSAVMNDDNGAFGAALYYVGDDNDVFVIANIAPTLSFNIRDLGDTTDTNTCNLGSVSTATGNPNGDAVDDGPGECGYGLAIGTNAQGGFQVQINADSVLDNASSSIIDLHRRRKYICSRNRSIWTR